METSINFLNDRIKNIANTPNAGIVISSGEMTGVSSLFKFGRNPSVGTTEEVLWDGGGTYEFLSSAETLDVVSSSTDDDDGGLGAQSLIINGLDENYDEISEVVVMDGTNPVTTTKSFLRVYRAIVLTAGTESTTADANIGTITISPSISTTKTQAVLLPRNGQTLMMVYTVPRGKTMYVTGLSASSGTGQAAVITAKVRNGVGVGAAFSVKYSLDLFQGAFNGPLQSPFLVPEKTDVVINGKAALSTVQVSASFGAWIVDNDE